MDTVPAQTVRFIKQALFALDNAGVKYRPIWDYHFYRGWKERAYSIPPEDAKDLILELEQCAKENILDAPGYATSEFDADDRYPVFHDTVDVIPVYGDSVVLECHRPLVSPSRIRYLLYLTRIPGYSEGVDVENHGFGYHFHFGKVKSHALVRTNLLLTFNPESVVSSDFDAPVSLAPRPLWGEKHSEGRCKSIEIESFGLNKRIPIYSVCLVAGEMRGFENFKKPGNKARKFHPDV